MSYSEKKQLRNTMQSIFFVFTQFLGNTTTTTNNNRLVLPVFEIPQVHFAFDFESEWPNGNLATKQLPNSHSSDLDKVGQIAEW